MRSGNCRFATEPPKAKELYVKLNASRVSAWGVTILFIALILGCSGAPKNEGFLYDYIALTALDIELKIEIGESENFLPGHLQDLVIDDDGSLIVSDWDSRSIVQFTGDGSFKRVLAEQGQGPGEIKNFFSLIDSRRDTLLVKFFGIPRQVDFYILQENGGGYVYDSSLIIDAVNNRIIDPIESAPGDGFFAKFGNLNQNRGSDLLNPPLYSFETLGIVNRAAEVLFDSVHVLQTPNTIFIEAREGALTPIGTPPYLSEDQIKHLPDGMYLITRPKEGLIQVFDQNHEIHYEISVDVMERPVTGDDLDYHLKHIPEQFQEELRNRAPDIKPAFTDAWGTNEYFLLEADQSEEGIKMVLISKSGEAAGKFFLSQFDVVQHFSDQRIYTLHKDPESGHSIRVYDINI